MHIISYGGAGTAVMVLHAVLGHRRDVLLEAVVDDFENGHVHPKLGVPVISAAQRREWYPHLPVSIHVGSPQARRDIMQRLDGEGAFHFTERGDRENVWEDVVVGDGSLVEPRTRVGPDVVIGRGVYCLASVVAHDVTIGDHTTLGISSTVLGHVSIGNAVNVAPRATICNGSPNRRLTIGNGAVIGTGAVVTKDVPAGAVVAGNPAKSLRQLATGAGEK